jgi:cytochrome c oxidase assembly protein subunit 15
MTATVADDFHMRAIRLWLYAVAALVLVMVLVGGATRLTESGLSITEWRPVTGALPPLSEGQWQAEFQKYQAIPQYRELNRGMSLAEFKTIFWWEWAHRSLGRLIGVAFLLPFLWFLWRGWIPGGLRPRLWFIFGLGALQGAVGWWMVASGLADRVEVSQYRLATHLVLACAIYVVLVWTARRLGEQPSVLPHAPAEWQGRGAARLRAGAAGLLALVLLQIYVGALVAGLRAGYVYNTWPLIDGAFVPESSRLFFQMPLWRNFFENTLTVQFDHRMLAYAIWLCALAHVFDAWRSARGRLGLAGAVALLAALTLQAVLGIWTVLAAVPLPIALLHQAVAMLVVTVATMHAASFVNSGRRSDAQSMAVATPNQMTANLGERRLRA